jgi:hypothetical protein
MNAAFGVRFAAFGVLAIPLICPLAGENAISKFRGSGRVLSSELGKALRLIPLSRND